MKLISISGAEGYDGICDHKLQAPAIPTHLTE